MRLEVAEVADLHLSQGTCSRIASWPCVVVTAARISAPMPTKKVAERVEQVGLGGDGDALAREVEVPVEQRILQLRPAAADRGRRRPARKRCSSDDEAIDRLQAMELAEHRIVDAGQLAASARPGAHMLADGDGQRGVAERTDVVD